MSKERYVTRLSDAMLEDALGTFGAVVIEGPKWCGKTTSASRLAASELRILDPAGQFQNRRFAQTDPAGALQGTRPRLIDEWQEVPMLWDAVRFACDEALGAPNQFILTGSSVPRPHGKSASSEAPVHSGAGRIGRVRMSTFTMFELGKSTGEISLGGLMRGERYATAPSSIGLSDYAEIICRGGWPATTGLTTHRAMLTASSYIDAVATSDLSRVDGVRRDSAKVTRVIASLARNESTLATNKVLLADMGDELADSTLRDYRDALTRVFFINDIPAWSPSLRSSVKIRSAAKHHLADPSLVAAALGATPESLVNDLRTMGFLFESLALHDLDVYARTLGAQIMHYRDDSGLEVDSIVSMPGGDWGAFEIKLGANQEEAAASSLCALERKMVERGERPATVKAVIVGVGGFGYTRPDGVQVVPLDRLGA